MSGLVMRTKYRLCYNEKRSIYRIIKILDNSFIEQRVEHPFGCTGEILEFKHKEDAQAWIDDNTWKIIE